MSHQGIQSFFLDASLIRGNQNGWEDEEVKKCVSWMDSFEPNRRKYFETLGENTSRLVPSTEKAPIVEQKWLPTHLRYACLSPSSTLPVIISSNLTSNEEERLLRVLKEHKTTIGWTLLDIKGIRPSICMHRILLEDDSKPSIEAHRRINPTMKEVVWK